MEKRVAAVEKDFIRRISDRQRLLAMLKDEFGEDVYQVIAPLAGDEQHYHKAKLLKALTERFGDNVLDMAAKQEGERVFKQWRAKASKHQSGTIDDLIELLWEPLKRKGFVYSVEKTRNGVQMRCTSCPLYDWAKREGLTREAFHMFCTNDAYITEGFNAEIGFRRSKTLMEGHDCCNHFYYLKGGRG